MNGEVRGSNEPLAKKTWRVLNVPSGGLLGDYLVAFNLSPHSSIHRMTLGDDDLEFGFGIKVDESFKPDWKEPRTMIVYRAMFAHRGDKSPEAFQDFLDMGPDMRYQDRVDPQAHLKETLGMNVPNPMATATLALAESLPIEHRLAFLMHLHMKETGQAVELKLRSLLQELKNNPKVAKIRMPNSILSFRSGIYDGFGYEQAMARAKESSLDNVCALWLRSAGVGPEDPKDYLEFLKRPGIQTQCAAVSILASWLRKEDLYIDRQAFLDEANHPRIEELRQYWIKHFEGGN